MKKRPEKWQDLPYSVKESIISNCDLEYDAYEGSNAEATAALLNGDYCRNGEAVQSYYKQLSDDELFNIVCNNIQSLQNRLNDLIDFRNKLKEQ